MSKPSVLIVGAGEFGAATAVSLLQSGRYSDVTVIDRAAKLPAMDAASCDINKVVRWDYSDADYSALARRAIDVWNRPEWKGIYHQTGVVVTGLEGDDEHGRSGRQIYANVKAKEPAASLLSTPEEFLSKLAPTPGIDAIPPPPHVRGYHNPIGGWANAAKAVEKLYEWLNELGGKLVPGAEMAELLYTKDGRDVKGVRCVDGREFTADKLIVALGSWTPSHPALSGLLAPGLITATGQTVAALQLSPEDAKRYASIPISMHHDGSGYYAFPPADNGLVKFALHGAGYLSESGVPRTAADPIAVGYTEEKRVGWIPSDSLKVLRAHMQSVYPELGRMPITFTRMCWYSDVVDGHWVIDYSKRYPSLLFATGGAGHAFKFLPILGDLIRDRLEGKLDPLLAEKWRADRIPASVDPARINMQRRRLDLEALATQRELRASL